MDSYTCTTTSSPKSKPLPSFHSYLHSVRKPMKKPIAPFPPTPPKVYKVDPINFKSVVQRLTSVPPRRLQDVAPPPLNLSSRENIVAEAAPLCLFPSPDTSFKELENLEAKPVMFSEPSPLGFGLSPSSISWCSFALMSPASLSSWGQSPVL